MHQDVDLKVLYFGTPVVLIGTRNADGTGNLAPMSSALWLGDQCMLGMNSGSQTTGNLLRERECTLNLPSADLVAAVDRLALLSGSPGDDAAQGGKRPAMARVEVCLSGREASSLNRSVGLGFAY